MAYQLHNGRQNGTFAWGAMEQTVGHAGEHVALKVYRASETDIQAAYGIVTEYYEAAQVIVREDTSKFAKEYFVPGAGVWLTEVEGTIVGCIALRKLADLPGCAEIKRLYVRKEHRAQGIADSLLEAVEAYAKECGYLWLYLDTAADMKAAACFYERKGFRPCERYNQNPQAAIFMKKSVR